MRRRGWSWALAAVLASGGCATGGAASGGSVVPPAARAEAVARAVGADGPTAERWRQGETLFSARCQRCHALPNPASVSPEKWPTEVLEMSRKSGLSGAEVAQVSDYLVAASRATR